MKINIKLLILILMLIFVINNFYYKNCHKIVKLEKFSNTVDKSQIKSVRDLSYKSNIWNDLSKFLFKVNSVKNYNSDKNNDGVLKDFKISGNFNLIPFQKGIIVAFKGPRIPSGWAECNGQKIVNSHDEEIQTPDLTGRFILGTGKEYFNKSTLTGGEKEVTLTGNQIPKHKHPVNSQGAHNHSIVDKYLVDSGGSGIPPYGANYSTDTSFGSNYSLWAKMRMDNDATSSINHSHNSPYYGESKPHNNMPPYYVLIYIMKIE